MIKINRSHLVDCLEKAKRAMASKSTLPSTKHFLVNASDRFEVHATDLDWGATLSTEAECDAEVSFLAPSLLLDVTKSLNDPWITLIPDIGSCSLTVKSARGETVLNILSPDDFPKIPEITGLSFVIDSELLNGLVALGSACAIKNTARPLWSAVCCIIQDRMMELVSTDQFSLSLARSPIDCEDMKFIVAADTLKEIVKLMSGEVTVTVNETMVSFDCPTAKCYSRLIDGQYYAYQQVIPKVFTTSIETDRKVLINTVTRASIVASEEDRAVRIVVDEGFTLKAGSGDKGHMEETLESTVSGDPAEVWLQHVYLSKALKGLSGDTVTISISGAVSPMKIEGSEKGFFVVMPMSKPRGV